MNPNPDYRLKHYGAQRFRNLQGALVQRLGSEFPRLGGPRILGLCAQMIMEVVDEHLPARERLAHGQIIWQAIDLDERPRRNRTGAQTRTRAVVLTLHDPSDVVAFSRASIFLIDSAAPRRRRRFGRRSARRS